MREMWRSGDWKVYFRGRLAKVEAELAGFESAIAKYGLKIIHRDAVNGEVDVTDSELLNLRKQIEEYRVMLRDD
jgi:hypothetical protein